jgi:hypothetical protein
MALPSFGQQWSTNASNSLTIGTITVSNNTTSYGHSVIGHACGLGCPYYHWYTTPPTVYKYQVKCPKCKTNNWLELETTVPCSKCKCTLKATLKSKPDYEVYVGE